MNGFVYFSGSKCCYVSQPSLSNLISGQNYDINTEYGGQIYYENMDSASNVDFGSVQSDLSKLNSTFVPTNIFRVTFDGVVDAIDAVEFASFQIILASDSAKSYVMLKYTSCVADLLTTPGLYYLNTSNKQSSKSIVDPCNSSNVNSNGLWIFDVTNSNCLRFFF